MQPKQIITIKNENRILVGLFFLLGGLGSVVLIGIMIYGLFFDNHEGERIDEYISILIPLILGSLIINQKALWMINGKDVVKIYDNFLTIESKGSLFHYKPKRFNFEPSLKASKIKKDSLGVERNNILLSGIDGYRKFGQGLNETTIERYIEKVNQMIQKNQN